MAGGTEEAPDSLVQKIEATECDPCSRYCNFLHSSGNEQRGPARSLPASLQPA